MPPTRLFTGCGGSGTASVLVPLRLPHRPIRPLGLCSDGAANQAIQLMVAGLLRPDLQLVDHPTTRSLNSLFRCQMIGQQTSGGRGSSPDRIRAPRSLIAVKDMDCINDLEKLTSNAACFSCRRGDAGNFSSLFNSCQTALDVSAHPR